MSARNRKDCDGGTFECSFCGKGQFVVRQLVSSASHSPRTAYICDECIRICAAILADESDRPANHTVSVEHLERHPALDHPEISKLLRFLERWVQMELAGANSAATLAEVRDIATRILNRQEGRGSD